MITVRRSEDRGHFDHGWLDTRHSFSFAGYQDPAFMGYRTLRVINEDVVAAGAGFNEHGHQDMEILTYVLGGALAHADSEGNQGVMRAGEMQRMTAGTGIRHSEMNGSQTEASHFLQIWILPQKLGVQPGYEQVQLDDSRQDGELRLVAAPEGNEHVLTVQQDVRVYDARLPAGATVRHELATGRGAWLQVFRGEVQVLGETLRAGDGASIEAVDAMDITGVGEGGEFLLFDLA
jgi:redox-sensitive bicupin YhaK (pirin superfamily)